MFYQLGLSVALILAIAIGFLCVACRRSEIRLCITVIGLHVAVTRGGRALCVLIL